MKQGANLEKAFRPFLSWMVPLLGIFVFMLSLSFLLEEYGEEVSALLSGEEFAKPWRVVHLLLVPILAGVLTTLLVVSLVREGALRRSRARMRSLLDHTGDAIVVLDTSWGIRYINRAAENLFATVLAEIQHLPLETLFEEGGARWFRRIGMASGATRALVEGKASDGRRLDLEATLSAFPVTDGIFHSIILRDLTERKALEEREAIQRRILRHFNASSQADALGRGLFEILEEALPRMAGCALFLVEGTALRLVSTMGEGGARLRPLEEIPPSEEALEVVEEPMEGVVGATLGLWSGADPVGYLGILFPMPSLDHHVEAFLRLLAHPLSTALDRTRSVRTAEGRGRRLGHATAFAEALVRLDSREDLFRAALQHLSEEFGFTRGWFYVLDARMEPILAWPPGTENSEAPEVFVLDGGGLFLDEREGESLVARPISIEGDLLGAMVFQEEEGGGEEVEGDLLTAFGAQVAVALANLGRRERLEESFVSTLNVISELLEMRDAYTEGHSERLSIWAGKVGKRLGMGEREIRDLSVAARIHDIGKIGISDDILLKPGPLSTMEFERMKTHPDLGVKALHHLSELKDIVRMVAHHHERYDGRGYPRGLKGESIPLGARVISVVDTFDAITSHRPYRKRRSRREAVEILRKNAGSQFDPKVVEIFLGMLEEEG